MSITRALHLGRRSLRVGSLPRLLAEKRDYRFNQRQPGLSIEQILRWADAHHARTGRWPHTKSGKVADAEGVTWTALDVALKTGLRGLPSGDSLARLFARERGARNSTSLPKLSEERILAWAQAHLQNTGRWPTQKSGPVQDAPGETWGGIDSALVFGCRGLIGGSSLPKLLDRLRRPS